MFTATEAVLIFFSGVMCTVLFQLVHDGKELMERCALTQVPCREAIAEIVAENKNRYFLQRTYEVAKILLDGSKEEKLMSMSEEDQARFFLIWNILCVNETDEIKKILSFSDCLATMRFRKRAEAQKE